jgi:hypothetical protein
VEGLRSQLSSAEPRGSADLVFCCVKDVCDFLRFADIQVFQEILILETVPSQNYAIDRVLLQL